MATADSRSIAHLPGWRYIVLPAPQHDEPKPTKPERRRLADNVVALFHEDRPPVVNVRWRGRYPRVVTRLRTWSRLHAGDYCTIWGSRFADNNGKVVRLLEQDRRAPFKWHIKAVSDALRVCWEDEPDNAEGYDLSWQCVIDGAKLRRCMAPHLAIKGAQ